MYELGPEARRLCKTPEHFSLLQPVPAQQTTIIPPRPFPLSGSPLTINHQEKPVLLSLDGRGFYVLHYNAIPEQKQTRITFDLVDPNTGEGATTDALVDPKLIQDLNSYNTGPATGKAFLIWIDTTKQEVAWQQRKIEKAGP